MAKAKKKERVSAKKRSGPEKVAKATKHKVYMGSGLSQVSVANKYLAVLRAQASSGVDYARELMGTRGSWFFGMFMSFVLFFVLYLSSWASSTFGKREAADVLLNASEKEIRPLMNKFDPTDNNGRIVLDMTNGRLSASKVDDGRGGLVNTAFTYLNAMSASEGTVPGDPNEWEYIRPDGQSRRVTRRPLPSIDAPIDRIIAERECNLTKEEATSYLCSRGVSNNRMARKAVQGVSIARREMNSADGVAKWRSCTKKVIRDHYSREIRGLGVSRGSVGVGKGMEADIPPNMCF